MSLQTAPLMANARARIVLNKCIVVKRTLIGSGEVTVTKGTEVAPFNIIGKSNLSRGFSAVPLSKQLGISPDSVSKYLTKPMGSTIFKGELLATKKGLFGPKDILAPTDGVLDFLDQQTGELRLKFLAKHVSLTAGVFGIVEEADGKTGTVLIKTMATLVYGIVGFGDQRGGTLAFIDDQSGPVNSSQITPAMHQHVLVAGAIIFKDALIKAAGLEVQGIVSGGFNLADYQAMVGSLDDQQRLESDVGITVLTTEGFGPIPMGDDIYQILKTFEGKFVIINGNKRVLILPAGSEDSILALRKISLAKNSDQLISPEVLLGEITVGSKVRLIWPPLMGIQGVVVALDNTPSLLESGLSTYLVTVETAHRKVKVPFPNLELVI